jgi:hypothetical protein
MRMCFALCLAWLGMLCGCGAAAGGDSNGYASRPPDSPPASDEESPYYVAPPDSSDPGTADPPAAGGASSDPQPGGTGGNPPEPPGGEPGTQQDAGVADAAPAPSACTYPAGPYGATQGLTVSPSIFWFAFAPGASSAAPVSPGDFFDCDGSRGINAVLIVYGAGWCSACAEEAGSLPPMIAQWSTAGVRVLYLIWQDPSGWPADTAFAKQWRDYYHLDGAWVAADPDFQLDSPAASALPYKMLIDPRTMRIVGTWSGEDGDDGILQLAYGNQ